GREGTAIASTDQVSSVRERGGRVVVPAGGHVPGGAERSGSGIVQFRAGTGKNAFKCTAGEQDCAIRQRGRSKPVVIYAFPSVGEAERSARRVIELFRHAADDKQDSPIGEQVGRLSATQD